MASTALNAATCFLVLLVLLAPLPWGAVLPAGHLLIQILSFAAAAVSFAAGTRPGSFREALIPLCALFGIAVLGILQLMPLPASILSSIASWNVGVYAEANRILAIFDRPSLTPRISIAPGSTTSVTLLVLSYAAAFSAAAIAGASAKRRRLIAITLLAASAVHVLAATALTSGARERIRGSFINPNNFAGYLQIAAAFAFAWIWLELLKGRERVAGINDMGLRFQKRTVPIVLRVLLWGIIVAGIGASRSRGGILAVGVTTLFLLTLGTIQRRARSRKFGAAALTAVLGGLVFVAVSLGNAPLLRFLASDPRDLESDTRVLIWKASIKAFELSPIFGSGLGTYRESFRHVQPADVRGLVEHAHNDFLQMLVTGGFVGAALITVVFVSALAILLRRVSAMTRREDSAFVLGGTGALIALLLHGIVEFNLSIPAIPVTLAIMMGVSWAAATAESR